VPLMGVDFVNQEDRSQFVADIEFPSGTKLEETTRLTEAAERSLLADQRISAVFSTLGASGEVNKAQWRVLTLPKDRRDVHINELKDAARKVLATLPAGTKTNVTDPPFVEGGAAPSPITVNVRATTYAELEPMVAKFEAEMRKISGMSDIKVKYNPGAPELQIKVDREKAERLGVPVAVVALSVRAAINGDEAGKLRQGKDEVPIKVRLHLATSPASSVAKALPSSNARGDKSRSRLKLSRTAAHSVNLQATCRRPST
jgi:hydrophobic/amphiphilic exporter-1 (mainly G- bacteria), HAE1 family